MVNQGFNINKAYADNALEKRSMFQRDFTVLLMALATLDPHQVPAELEEAHNAIGNASFSDLFWKLPKYFFNKTLKKSAGSFMKAAVGLLSFDLSPMNLLEDIYLIVNFVYRLICLPMSLIGAMLLFPVNMAYGALDWLGLQGALAFFKHSKNENDAQKINRSTWLSFGISIITIPVRLAFGLIEAIQEPFHLYDFWVKGAVDAMQERENHEISKGVFAIKLFLHAFKVICTLGAILTIVGITAIPFISKGFDYLGKVAYGFLDVKNFIPKHKYIFDMPIKGLKHTLVQAETLAANVTGLHYSHASKHANTDIAVKLGFESALTKGAGLLPMKDGYTPGDTERRERLKRA